MPHFNHNKSPINLIHDIAQISLLIYIFMLNIALVILLAFDSTGALFLGFDLPRTSKFLPVYLFLFSLHAYLTTVLYVGAMVYLTPALFYFYYVVIFYTVEFKLRQPESAYRSLKCLRTIPEKLRHTFRAFQVLHTYCTYIPSRHLIIFNAGITLAAIYITFVSIRYWDQLEVYAKVPLLIADVFVSGIWSLALLSGKYLFCKGHQALNSWKMHPWGSEKECKIMKKFRLSCKPLLLSCGTLFVVRKASIFGFFKGVTRGTCRALLMTK